MSDILKELFESSFYSDSEPSDKLAALRKQEADLWEKALPVLGLEAVDEINNTQGAIAEEIDLMWFRRGFHLGASLFLELLWEPAATESV